MSDYTNSFVASAPSQAICTDVMRMCLLLALLPIYTASGVAAATSLAAAAAAVTTTKTTLSFLAAGCRCGCCNITHKLIDNLKLFHELSHSHCAAAAAAICFFTAACLAAATLFTSGLRLNIQALAAAAILTQHCCCCCYYTYIFTAAGVAAATRRIHHALLLLLLPSLPPNDSVIPRCCRCGCCNITHKLIDNLKLFHELSGPVFNTPMQPNPSSSSSSGSSSSDITSAGGIQDDEGLLQYGADGFPVLPERLRLRMPPWTVPGNFPDDTSNYN
jgi:hypothetical protein